MSIELQIVRSRPDIFPQDFVEVLAGNEDIYQAFEREAMKVVHAGYIHYSARTILEVLRHHSNIVESAGSFKLNNNHTPYWGRLFALKNPRYATLFEFRSVTRAITVHGGCHA